LTIQVDSVDISAGVRYSNRACPVCCAIARHTGRRALVGHFHASVGNRQYILDASCQAWILRFDRGEPVDPIRFAMAVTHSETSGFDRTGFGPVWEAWKLAQREAMLGGLLRLVR
jgi:hypothetical protein